MTNHQVWHLADARIRQAPCDPRGALYLLWALLACLGLSSTVEAATPSISAAELRAFLQSKPDTSQEPRDAVIAVLTTTGRKSGPEAAARELSHRWNISMDAAGAVIDLMVLQSATQWSPDRSGSLRIRSKAAHSHLIELAGSSRDVWHILLESLSEEGCDDAAARDQYLHQPWALDDLLRNTYGYCKEWLTAVPTVAPASALLYARIAGSAGSSDLDTLLALRALRDSLAQKAVPLQDAARLHAQRRYWLMLAELGLWKTLLTEARALSPQDAAAIRVACGPAGGAAAGGGAAMGAAMGLDPQPWPEGHLGF